MKKGQHKLFKVYTLLGIMKNVITKNEFKLWKVMIFSVLVIGFDLLDRNLIKSVVFAIFLAILIMEVYNGCGRK